jgi:hypothetical protein
MQGEDQVGFSLAMRRRGDRLALFLAAIGERHGYGWLTYNPGIMRIFHRYARVDAAALVGALKECFPAAARWADVGAGSGAYAAAARRAGLDAVGYEISPFGRLLGRAQGAAMRRFDLTKAETIADVPRADLAYCLEVAEHLDAGLGDRLVTFLAGLSPVVVFTAAPPGQGGIGHINEQPPDYWIDRFARAGVLHDPDETTRLARLFDSHGVRAPWLARNLMVFRRD